MHNSSNVTFNAFDSFIAVETLQSPRFSISSIVLTGTSLSLKSAGTDKSFSFLIFLRLIIVTYFLIKCLNIVRIRAKVIVQKLIICNVDIVLKSMENAVDKNAIKIARSINLILLLNI